MLLEPFHGISGLYSTLFATHDRQQQRLGWGLLGQGAAAHQSDHMTEPSGMAC